jgi:hypothetical protein
MSLFSCVIDLIVSAEALASSETKRHGGRSGSSGELLLFLEIY